PASPGIRSREDIGFAGEPPRGLHAELREAPCRLGYFAGQGYSVQTPPHSRRPSGAGGRSALEGQLSLVCRCRACPDSSHYCTPPYGRPATPKRSFSKGMPRRRPATNASTKLFLPPSTRSISAASTSENLVIAHTLW